MIGKNRYERILIKLSGESLMGNETSGISATAINTYINEIIDCYNIGYQIGIVVGGGNFFRGIQSKQAGVSRITGDKMGMLATAMNALAIRDIFVSRGIDARVQTPMLQPSFAEIHSTEKAKHHLDKNRIVIFAGGTSNPLFTTDTAAALRAIEIEADILIKATNVDGVYDDDPRVNPDATLKHTLTYNDCINKNLKVMDTTAFVLCQENNMPIGVFNIHKKGNLAKFLKNETKLGTIICG